MSKILLFAVEVDSPDEAHIGEYFDVVNDRHNFLDARLFAIEERENVVNVAPDVEGVL